MIGVAETTEPHILCTDLVRIFTADGVEVQALQGLNLRVDPGEMVAVVGASGSGKSTLLTILSGLDTATAGVARVAGHDLLTMGSRERVAYQRRTVGFVWQQTSRNLLPYLTAGENIALAMNVARTRRGAERAHRVDELLELTGVGEAMRGVNEELGVTTLIVTHDPTVSGHVRRTVQIRDGRTSTEVLRSRRVDEHGAEEHVAEEFAVLDRVGRLQLPHEFVQSLALRDRVRLALEPDHVGVWPGHEGADAPPRRVASNSEPPAASGPDDAAPTHRGRHAAPASDDAPDTAPEEDR